MSGDNHHGVDDIACLFLFLRDSEWNGLEAIEELSRAAQLNQELKQPSWVIKQCSMFQNLLLLLWPDFLVGYPSLVTIEKIFLMLLLSATAKIEKKKEENKSEKDPLI